ncbi:ribosome silencing factor [Parapedobacter tibetensis]|uniref:ribosome silencing factor n=1 Tax=Parapedobacter tibetensis TaxID=2972951 RepID=UPI00214DA8FA|nr:ribosome silencing factor [Parapedobacter tibetensis]
MVKNKKSGLSVRLSEVVIQGMQERKGNEIVRLDLRNIHSSVSDYFVICHADSSTQVNSLAKSVEEEVYKALQQEPWRKEGLAHGEWILLDFVDVVVHIFKTDKRKYYGIEDLWGDAELEYYQSAS